MDSERRERLGRGSSTLLLLLYAVVLDTAVSLNAGVVHVFPCSSYLCFISTILHLLIYLSACAPEYVNIHLMKEVKAPPLQTRIEGLETIGQGSRDGNKPLHHFFFFF